MLEVIFLFCAEKKSPVCVIEKKNRRKTLIVRIKCNVSNLNRNFLKKSTKYLYLRNNIGI